MASPPVDTIDPIDYEEYLDEHREKIELDPLRHLLEYPHDDIDFVRIERQYRTIIPVMPEKESDSTLDGRTRRHHCVFFFLQSVGRSSYSRLFAEFQRRTFSSSSKVRASTLTTRLAAIRHRLFQLRAVRQCGNIGQRSSRAVARAQANSQTRFRSGSDRRQSTDVDRTGKSCVSTRASRTSTCLVRLQDSPRKSALNDSSSVPLKSSWALAKDDLDKTEPDTIMPHLSEIVTGRLVSVRRARRPILVERIPIESVDKENELLRAKNRHSKLFSCYPPQLDVSAVDKHGKRAIASRRHRTT
jgi:hypothetical protein